MSLAEGLCGVEELFKQLKYQREYYSYFTPLNNLFAPADELDLLHNTILDCYQLVAFHSLMLHKSSRKHSNGIARITTDCKEQFDTIFAKLFAKADEEGNLQFDDSAANVKAEITRHGAMPEYVLLDLDHQFDEFHTYDSFYNDNNENMLQISDIWKELGTALIFG